MRILCFGDSITWGSFDTEQGGWVSRVRRFFDKNYMADPAVYNLGISGDKLLDLVKRFESDFESRKDNDDNSIIIAIGINDSPHNNYLKGTPLEQFEVGFRDLLRSAKIKSDKILVLGPTNVSESSKKKHGYDNQLIKRYAEVIEEQASKNDLVYIGLFGHISEDDLKIDGLHPNYNGHQKIYERVIKELMPLLGLKNTEPADLNDAKLFTDGGSRGNPGPSAIAFVICKIDNSVVEKSGEYIGETTNNQAEYQALKMGLKRVQELGVKNLTVNLDSELVVKQINGLYKIKNQELLPHYNEVKNLAGKFEQIAFQHVPRALNAAADKEVNRILDKESKK